MKTHRFKNGVVIKVWHSKKYIEIHFKDGTMTTAIPIPGQERTAAEYGYSDTWDLVFEHEVTHCWLSDVKGWPYSMVLWDVAHGIPATDMHYEEEGQVLEIQGALNGINAAPFDLTELQQILKQLNSNTMANKKGNEPSKENQINAFATEVTLGEGGKSNASRGDVAQVLKIADKLLGGALYAAIRLRNQVPPAPPID